MGGSSEADTIDNVAWLCRLHHHLLDGRYDMLGIPRSQLWIDAQLRYLGIEYVYGRSGTKFEVRTALGLHIQNERAARRDRATRSASSAAVTKQKGCIIETT